ncbi:MAG: glycosyltransferase family 39 protein, partial [Nitrospinota bacterium]|nr:glycosyltransferase family 39 protein [Nitrospinota bacterium]
LRMWSLLNGAQDGVFYDDAWHFMPAIKAFFFGNYLYDNGYPHFSSHITEFVLRFIFWLYGFMKIKPVELEFSFMYFVALWLNLIYAAVTLFLTYKIGMLIKRRDAAILATFLVGVSLTETGSAHYYVTDVPMAFLALIGVYFAALNLREEKTHYYILSGLFIGLSFSAKFNGLLSFIHMGLIYLLLHPTRRDFMENLEKPLKAVAAFMLIYLLVNPLFIADPWAKFDHTMVQTYSITFPQWMGHHNPTENTLKKHIELMASGYDYHIWATGGLFAPIPLLLGIAAIGFVGYTYRWRLAFLWFSPIPFIIIGRFAKPNAAPFHFLNLIPLLMLPVAIGILDALKLLPSRLARGVVMSVLVVWCSYASLQDASFWSLPPSFKIQHDWLEENLDASDLVKNWKDMVVLGQGDPKKIRDIYTGPERWCYVLHRDARYYVFIRNGAPALFPLAHFPSQRQEASIFPASQELATTERVFATGPETKLYDVVRYIMAAETGGRIMAWARNASLEPSEVRLRIGGASFKRTLKPGEAALFEAPVEGNRTFLLEGRYVKVIATSEGDTAWALAANHDQVADLLLEMGEKSRALAEYSASGSAYSLLRIMALAPEQARRLQAALTLKGKFPDLHKTLATLDPQEWTFQSLAGYDDRIFQGKMTRFYGYNDFHRRNIPPSGLTLVDSEAGIWGPYTPVMKGDYIVDFKWLTYDKAPESFLVDIATRRFPNNEIVKKLSIEDARKGMTTISISEENAASFPFEIMVAEANGGMLGVMEVGVTIDYLTPLQKLALAARDGVGLENLGAM